MDHISPLLQALIDNLGESAAVIVLAILGLSATKIQTWWKDRTIKRFERGINQNVRLRELLSELRVPYTADRVRLYQFHNGDYYHSGESIMKCSLTHFVTKVGVANPIGGQSIPSTQMVLSLKAIQDKSSVLFTYGTLEDDSFLDGLFLNNGSFAVLVTAVRDSRKNWVGVLCVDWLTDPGIRDDKSLLVYARQIGDFLSTKA
jgi:hypothetical protein